MSVFGLAYLVWITVIVAAAMLLRRWYRVDLQRSQSVFWILLTLACPILPLIAYLSLKMLRIRWTPYGRFAYENVGSSTKGLVERG